MLGKSLGGAVALHVAAANPGRVAAVVVENTFLSIEDVAPKVGRGRAAVPVSAFSVYSADMGGNGRVF